MMIMTGMETTVTDSWVIDTAIDISRSRASQKGTVRSITTKSERDEQRKSGDMSVRVRRCMISVDISSRVLVLTKNDTILVPERGC